MICPSCGYNNIDVNAKFCGKCGMPFSPPRYQQPVYQAPRYAQPQYSQYYSPRVKAPTDQPPRSLWILNAVFSLVVSTLYVISFWSDFTEWTYVAATAVLVVLSVLAFAASVTGAVLGFMNRRIAPVFTLGAAVFFAGALFSSARSILYMSFGIKYVFSLLALSFAIAVIITSVLLIAKQKK